MYMEKWVSLHEAASLRGCLRYGMVLPVARKKLKFGDNDASHNPTWISANDAMTFTADVASGNSTAFSFKGANYADPAHRPGSTTENANELMTIESNGDVGLGVTTPSAKLDVNATDNALRLRAGNINTGTTGNQILMSWSGGTGYTHAINSRHNANDSEDNAIDFLFGIME